MTPFIYFFPLNKYSQLGKHIFSDVILDTASFRSIIVAEVLILIKQDRYIAVKGQFSCIDFLTPLIFQLQRQCTCGYQTYTLCFTNVD